MNKKRLIISVIVLFLIIIGIFVLVKTLNKDKNGVENKDNQQKEVNFKEYTTSEWKEYASTYYEKITGNKPVSIKLFSDNSDVMIIEIYEDESSEFVQRYNLNYKTGKGTDLQGNEVDLELK